MTLEEREKFLREQEKLDIQTVMSTENGRRFLWRLLANCGIYRDIEGDTTQMLKQIGRRQSGLYLLSIISEADEESTFRMMKEAKYRDEEEKRFVDGLEEKGEKEEVMNHMTGLENSTPEYFVDEFDDIL